MSLNGPPIAAFPTEGPCMTAFEALFIPATNHSWNSDTYITIIVHGDCKPKREQKNNHYYNKGLAI